MYKKADLEKQSLELIQYHKFVFIEDLCSKLPCSKETFYAKKLHESDSIKKAIEQNKIDLKTGLRKKMYQAENPTAWIALYKLIGTDEESDKLNGSRQRIELSGAIKSEIQLPPEIQAALKAGYEQIIKDGNG